MTRVQPQQDRRLHAIVIFAHFFFSLIVNSFQPLLPVVQRTFGISIAQSAALPTVISLAITIFTLIIGILINRIGRKKAFMLSLILPIPGCLIIAFSPSFALFVTGYAIVGLAIGGGFTTGTTIYAGLPRQNFGLYHASFGLGGMASPLVLDLWIGWGLDFRLLYLFYLLLFLASAIILLFIKVPNPAPDTASASASENTGGSGKNHINRGLFASGVAFLASYAIVEVGSSTWASNMIIDGYGLPSASFILSGFWLLFTLSRLVSDWLARRLGPMRAIQILMTLSFFILLLWMLMLSPWIFILLGLSFGPVFSIAQKHFNSLLPDRQRGLFNGMTYAGNGTGIMLVVPIMGSLGNMNIALAFIPALLIAVLALFLSKSKYIQ